jgi:hypothetical protein
MSITGISSTAFSQYPLDNVSKTVRQDFQQLGQDLKAGNLSDARHDFTTLRRDLLTQTAQTPDGVNNNYLQRIRDNGQSPLFQDLNQLRQDLTSGNLSAAQQAYTALKTDVVGNQPHPEPPLSAPPVSTIGGGHQPEPPLSAPPVTVTPISIIGGHHPEPPITQPPVSTIGGGHQTEPPLMAPPVTLPPISIIAGHDPEPPLLSPPLSTIA